MISSETRYKSGCADVEAAFGALLSGDFTREEFLLVNRHLSECPACRRMHGSLSGFPAAFRDLYGVERVKIRPSRKIKAAALTTIAASFLAAFALTIANKAAISPTGDSAAVVLSSVAAPARDTLATVKSIAEQESRLSAVESITATTNTNSAVQDFRRRAPADARRTAGLPGSRNAQTLSPVDVRDMDIEEMVNHLSDEDVLELVS